MTPAQDTRYQNLLTLLHEAATLGSVGILLNWDERTQMPPRGAEHRARQAALIARLTHEKATNPHIGELLDSMAAQPPAGADDPHGVIATNLREATRDYRRTTRLPASLVEELARTEVLATNAWAEARAKSEYAIFSPWLEKMLVLKRQQAACLADGRDLYDALLDEFEPGETAAHLRTVFGSFQSDLAALVEMVKHSSRKAPCAVLERTMEILRQVALGRRVAETIGFDFQAGRMDVSLHPFCTEIGPNDTRLTTRYKPNAFADSFFGVLHETGHALYTQGLPVDAWGTGAGSYISLGIHESQSRLWENLVGRSGAFWKHFLPIVRESFAGAIDDVAPQDWSFAINAIGPSPIRVESDEATYNLHIILRFELEQSLLSGNLPVADLPSAWNAKLQKLLGITPKDDAQGCLQDIHWAGGAIGYFPTYTLGNLYACQFMEQAEKDLGDLPGMFAQGEFRPLLHWLRERIHVHGRRYSASELVQRVTGKPLTADALMRRLWHKADAYA